MDKFSLEVTADELRMIISGLRAMESRLPSSVDEKAYNDLADRLDDYLDELLSG